MFTSKLEFPDQSMSPVEADIPSPGAISLRATTADKITAVLLDEKVKAIPLSNEEKRRFLKPEILAKLSPEEYIALWRRLNPYFLSHVTRQGFRDHNAMIYHSAGMEQFHRGFLNVLEDQKLLRPPIAVNHPRLKSRDETDVREFLEDYVLKAENQKDAMRRLDIQLNNSLANAPKYPDKTSIHFATETVLDGYYGGESDNEIFFLFPSDFIASQHEFSFGGWEKDFTKPQSEGKWNDVFVWPSSLDNPGISVDAGVVFLPENTMVDPETGSKYASEVRNVDGKDQRVMIEDESLASEFVDWATGLNENSAVVAMFREYSKISQHSRTEKEYVLRKLEGNILNEMLQLGFSKDSAIVLADRLIGRLHIFIDLGRLDWDDITPKEAALRTLRSANANWKIPENPVKAKEYWEKYFKKNLDQKPKHIVYYSGHPYAAIKEWRQNNGIVIRDGATSDDKLLGFDDHFIADMEKDPRAYRGYNELLQTAQKIISENYGISDN